MSLYLDVLPDELLVIIVYYMDTSELRENVYLINRIVNKWPLLFTFAFPDIDIKLIEDIDYTIQDFDYVYLIYRDLKKAYSFAEDDLKNNTHQVYTFILDSIHNIKIKFFILNKNQIFKDLYFKLDRNGSLYLDIKTYGNKYQIAYDEPVLAGIPGYKDLYYLSYNKSNPIDLSNKEGLTLLVYIHYADVSVN